MSDTTPPTEGQPGEGQTPAAGEEHITWNQQPVDAWNQPPAGQPPAGQPPIGAVPPQPEPESQGSSTGRLLLVIGGFVVLLVGVAALALGLSSASSASSDRDDAQAELDAAQADLASAETELADAQAELESTVGDADAVIQQGQEVLAVAEELCDCDGRRTDLVNEWQAAADAGDIAALDSVGAEINTESDAANVLLEDLRAILGL